MEEVVRLEPLHLGRVDYREFAASVENLVRNKTFFTPSGEPIVLSVYRSFTPSHTANRLEIGINHDFTDAMTLDCRFDSEDRMTVTPTCNGDQQTILEQILCGIRTIYGLPQATSDQIPLSMPTSEGAQSIITEPQPEGRATLGGYTSESQTSSEAAGSRTKPGQVSKRKQKKKSPQRKRHGTAPRVAKLRRLVNDRGFSVRDASKIVGIDRGTAARWFDDEEVIALAEKVTDEELDNLLKKARLLR